MQGFAVGCTNYNDQSLADIVLDIEKWICFIVETKNYVEKTIDYLKGCGYWDKHLSFNYKLNCNSYLRYSKTIEDDLTRIKSDIISEEISNVTINLMHNVCNIVVKNADAIRESFNDDNFKKDYGNKFFLKAETLYNEICDTLCTIIDIENMTRRVEMFMKQKNELNVYNNNGVVVAGNNSGTINVNNQTNNFSYEGIIEITTELKNKLSNETIKDNDKQDALEMIDDIESKAKSRKSKKVIAAAFNGLKDFLISVGAGLMVEYIKYKTTGMF